ncbi:hypothetical protein CQW23_13812 [Capsicum baccatum]|uniref:XS domain-containing protein n=1 Tax=Capsicum baccatum TaxID=33114 RepID=A0A2G2WHE7_CAPBA|nr:hypothetical protein CQW23_13812 [Capsicum baccatum]PHU13603.1 hypothetical protein BC332_14808 [Capsicum chinense]
MKDLSLFKIPHTLIDELDEEGWFEILFVLLKRFSSDWSGFNGAIEFENAFEASQCRKQEWKTTRNFPGLNLYGWVALRDDYTAECVVGEYLRGEEDLLKTVSSQSLLNKKHMVGSKELLVNLANEIDLKDVKSE